MENSKKTKTTKHLHLGRAGELLVTSEFIKSGLDVFSSEVDDKGIDLVLKNAKGEYFDIQVKATNQNYVFMRKEVFHPRENLYVALLILNKKGEQLFALVPSLDFKKRDKPDFLKDNDYPGKKSKPEYGIYTSEKYTKEIKEHYLFSKIVINFLI